jgi:hypothetical protein
MRTPIGPLAGGLALLALSPAMAAAQSGPRPFVSPTISTLGLGVEAGLRLNELVGVRLGGNWLQFGFDRQIEEVDYEADATLGSIGTILDLHPFGGGFRVSGGARLNFNQADLTGRGEGTIEIDGQVFDAAEAGTIDGDVEFDTFAPYLGIGYGGSLLGGALALTFDLGVLYQGSPDVSLTANAGSLADDPTFQAALANEEQDVEDDLEDFTLYPVIGLAATYRF